MDSYHLSPFEEDELYSGFNEIHPTLNPSTLILEPLEARSQQITSLQVARSHSASFVRVMMTQ